MAFILISSPVLCFKLKFLLWIAGEGMPDMGGAGGMPDMGGDDSSGAGPKIEEVD